LSGKDLGVVVPCLASWRSHVFHLYTIKITKSTDGSMRNGLFKELADAGVQTSVHYTPLHLMSYYKQFLKKSDSFPVAEKLFKQILSLPLYPTLTKKDVVLITDKIKAFLRRSDSLAKVGQMAG